MTPEKKQRLFTLFGAHAADSLAPGELNELQETLRQDAEARQLWFVHQDIEMGLRTHLAHEASPSAWEPAASVRSWSRPLLAAAAGLAIGLFSASLVFGYVVPSWKTRIDLLTESFESGVAPLVDGHQPLKTGYWGGDFTEITGPMGNVNPADGKHMLRFVRADYEGHYLPDSFSSDTFRLIDVRAHKKEFADGTGVVRLSALFNGDISAADGPYACVLKIYALDAEFVADRQSGGFTGSIRDRMLANSSSTRVRLDADPTTWQTAGNELRLPPGTDYLMIQVGMSDDSKQPGRRKDAFAAHYADRVQLVLAHLPEIASR